jgi:hypothetical protein
MEVGRRSHKGGEWRTFLHDQVTACFPRDSQAGTPRGLGHPPDSSVRRESGKMLVIVHDSRTTA